MLEVPLLKPTQLLIGQGRCGQATPPPGLVAFISYDLPVLGTFRALQPSGACEPRIYDSHQHAEPQ